MLAFGEILPKEEIHKQLKESVDKYAIDPTEENEKGVELWSMMLLSKRATSHHKDGAFGVMKDLEKMERAKNLMIPNEG